MALKGWDPSFSVNIPNLDNDHKKMVQMISKLHEAMSQGKSKELITPLINELSDYTVSHFGAEEKYLRDKKHPELSVQMAQHKIFLDRVNEFKETVQTGKTAIAIQLLPFMNQWFLNHIMKMDMKYKA